jgi:hypothetical protein
MRAAPRRRSAAGRQRGAAAGGARDDGGVDLHLHVPGGQQGHDLRAPAQRLREASHGGETSRSSSTSPLLSLVAAFELWHLMIALRASCLLLVFAETPGESVGG